MKLKFRRSTIALLIICFGFSSCEKFLDKKPKSDLAVPSSINDLQLMLDNYSQMNNSYPGASEMVSDNFYFNSTDWAATSNEADRSLYLWLKEPARDLYWNNSYSSILTCNVVLDHIGKMNLDLSEQAKADNIKGSALFYRAYQFYGLAQLFAQPYDKNSAGLDLGIPLRLDPDFSEISVRASVQETYNQIIADLRASFDLLPVVPFLKTRPSKPAVYGALAKVYLAMQEYDSAGHYADQCLAMYGSNNLVNYNNSTEVNVSANAPFSRFNKEVIFHIRSPVNASLSPTRVKIDSFLYNSFVTNDRRKTAYFRSNGNGTYRFKGDYDASGTTGFVFAGVVTDEIYLIRAESYARKGNTTEAMAILNALLVTRWTSGTFTPFTATDANDALTKILAERRKELLFRGTRWTDLRRLMKESSFNITPKRYINGQLYELPPNSPRYTLQIPLFVIQKSGMPQNP